MFEVVRIGVTSPRRSSQEKKSFADVVKASTSATSDVGSAAGSASTSSQFLSPEAMFAQVNGQRPRYMSASVASKRGRNAQWMETPPLIKYPPSSKKKI